MTMRHRGPKVRISQYLVPAAQPPRTFCLDLIDDAVVRNYKVLGKPARASLERNPGSLRMWIFRELPEGGTRDSQRVFSFEGLPERLKAEASVRKEGEGAYTFGGSEIWERQR